MLLSFEIIAISASEVWSVEAAPVSGLSDGGSAAVTIASNCTSCEDRVRKRFLDGLPVLSED